MKIKCCHCENQIELHKLGHGVSKDIYDFFKKTFSFVEIMKDRVEIAIIKKLLEGEEYARLDCPFHRAKDDNLFVVNKTTQAFYCFKCHFGGDIVEFTAKMNNTTKEKAAKDIKKKYRPLARRSH